MTGGPFSTSDVAERLSAEIENWRRYQVQYWPVFRLSDSTLVGSCGLRPRNMEARIAELGFQLCPQSWGQGYASEAARAVIEWARTHDFATLIAGHHPSNHASKRALVRLGLATLQHSFWSGPAKGPASLKQPSDKRLAVLAIPRPVTASQHQVRSFAPAGAVIAGIERHERKMLATQAFRFCESRAPRVNSLQGEKLAIQPFVGIDLEAKICWSPADAALHEIDPRHLAHAVERNMFPLRAAHAARIRSSGVKRAAVSPVRRQDTGTKYARICHCRPYRQDADGVVHWILDESEAPNAWPRPDVRCVQHLGRRSRGFGRSPSDTRGLAAGLPTQGRRALAGQAHQGGRRARGGAPRIRAECVLPSQRERAFRKYRCAGDVRSMSKWHSCTVPRAEREQSLPDGRSVGCRATRLEKSHLESDQAVGRGSASTLDVARAIGHPRKITGSKATRPDYKKFTGSLLPAGSGYQGRRSNGSGAALPLRAPTPRQIDPAIELMTNL